MSNVLVLGAGMISPPLVRYLLARTGHRVLVGAKDTRRILAVIDGHPRGRAVETDVLDRAALAALAHEADMIVSLLPAAHNPAVARLAIQRRVPFLNTSYVSPELRELDASARAAGVLLLSEVGLDPGLDHMSALRAIHRVRNRGGTIVSLSSCCGGFPAPDANDNPWGYKFSWFPRAALLAGRNPARYLRDGDVVEVPGEQLFSRSWPYAVEGQGVFEIYPNRDALAYRDAYGLPEARGLFRGTLRYPGWCSTLRAAAELGLLDTEEIDWPPGTRYADVLARCVPQAPGSVIERVAARLSLDQDSEILARLEWAGLLSDRRIPETRAAPLDVFVNRLQKLMAYRPGERDMVALEHKIAAAYPDRHVEEVTETLVATGEPWGDSAMARTVALPAAVATRLILERAPGPVGVQIPVFPELYRPLLDELESLGLALRERRVPRYPQPL